MRSRSNSPMNVDGLEPKIIQNLNCEDLISDHESESGNYSQSDIHKNYKIEQKKKF